MLKKATIRRRLLTAFGKNNNPAPIKIEVTNGHRGTIQTYLYKDSINRKK